MVDPVLAQETVSTSTEIIQLTINGLALGAVYALIVLGFVIIYKATEVINFAQGALMLLGTYLVFTLMAGFVVYPASWEELRSLDFLGDLKEFPSWMQWWVDIPTGIKFALAVAIAAVLVALVGVLIERSVLRRMVGQPVFAIVLITLGLELVISSTVNIVWGDQNQALPSPFPVTNVLKVGDVAVAWSKVWAIIAVLLIVAAFFAFFRYSRRGVAMRATAFDQEAAMAMGIKASSVFALSWAMAGALAAIAGAFYVPTQAAGFIQFAPVRFAALNAFPAAILGGLDSPGGAVIGGFSIGLAQVYSARWLNPIFAEWNLPNFHVVFPFILMIIVLMVRPYGLYGTPEVRRV